MVLTSFLLALGCTGIVHGQRRSLTEQSLGLLQITRCTPALPLHLEFLLQLDGEQRQPKLCSSLEKFMGPENESTVLTGQTKQRSKGGRVSEPFFLKQV